MRPMHILHAAGLLRDSMYNAAGQNQPEFASMIGKVTTYGKHLSCGFLYTG